MADTNTPTYAFTQPEVGASKDTWGDKLNANWAKIDTLLGQTFTGGTGAAIGSFRPPNGLAEFRANTPATRWYESDQTTGKRAWQIGPANGVFNLYTAADDYTGLVSRLSVTRAGAVTIPSLDVTGSLGLTGGLDLGGELNITRANPLIDLVESDAPVAYAMTRLIRDGNSFYFQTKSDAGASLSTDYRMYVGTTGANRHSWSINNAVALDLTASGLTVTDALTVTGAINGSSNIIAAGAVQGAASYVNDDTNPSFGLRNVAGQTGATLYTDLATLGYWRQYESAASSNYTSYAFRYGGATSGNDVLRKTDGDGFYMRGPDVVNTGRYIAQTFEIQHTAPYLTYTETDEATNIRNWAAGIAGGNFAITPRDTAGTIISGGGGFNIYRTANGVTDARITFGSDGSASGLPTTDSIVTRASGDARYLNSSSAQNAVGSTIFGRNGGTVVGVGANVSGADLAYQNMDNSYTGTLSGTWKTCGNTTTATSQDRSTCFRRTA